MPRYEVMQRRKRSRTCNAAGSCQLGVESGAICGTPQGTIRRLIARKRARESGARKTAGPLIACSLMRLSKAVGKIERDSS
jgi:hypothetical protein